MIQKKTEKQKAIALRKRGLTYSEILQKIPAAKSTLSLWLRDVALNKKQVHTITQKKIAAARKGAQKKRHLRISKTREIKTSAQLEIGAITKRELWLIGTALYWAEGNKEKDYRPSEGVKFSNTDPKMMILFRIWIDEILQIAPKDVVYELYIHKNAKIQEAIQHWSKGLNINNEDIRVYLKKNSTTKRKNITTYHGVLRIKLRRSTDLNRKITGWIQGIVSGCGIV